MKKQTLLLILVLSMLLSACVDKKTYKPESDTILAQEVINSIIEKDSSFLQENILYSKFLPYDNEIEYPIICWERDSFNNRQFNIIPEPPIKSKFNNPFSMPNRIANTYLLFLFDKEIGRSLNTEDTLYFRQQIEFSKRIVKLSNFNSKIKTTDTCRTSDFRNETVKCMTFYSLPIFTKDKKFVFLRQFHQYKNHGEGEWLILQRKDNWTQLKTGNYYNRH